MKDTHSEQLEEGEIVDDDFEDISDNSIIEPTFGKFVSSNESLRALSLSSDSETDIMRTLKCKRKLLHRSLKAKHQRRRKKRRIVSESSDSDVSTPSYLKGKLKDAIHISGIKEVPKNPLEIRLKVMGGSVVTNTPASLASEGVVVAEKTDDNELENLRMEALKTAILNKFQRRKRKKALLESQTNSMSLEKQENKENNTPKDDLKNGEKPQPAIDLEDDEDLLRASLLAGLAKKITKTAAHNENTVTVKQIPPALPKRTVPTLSKTIKKRIPPKPQVKPLIINVNSDSDSEEETKEDAPAVQDGKPGMKSIASNVDKFLKEQRAQFETKTKISTPTNKRFQLVNKNKVLEKSAVKLLPKSQQIEYQQLLRKLRTAERRKRVPKVAQREQTKPQAVAIEVGPQGSLVEKTTASTSKIEIVVQPVVATSVKKSSAETKKSISEAKGQPNVGGKSTLTTELSTLQRTLKELKAQRNGSFQIKSKYQMLTPIIRKITATSSERKKHEYRIKKLLQELKEARKELARSHEMFSALVRELVSKKESVDRRLQAHTTNRVNGNRLTTVKVIATGKAKNEEQSGPVTSTPIKMQSPPASKECEDMDVCNSDEQDAYQIEIVDPNDIDQIFKRKPITKLTMPDYVSPLNFNSHERYSNVDPYGIMCPYELNGSCRDEECSYKHYLKSHVGIQ